MLNYLRKKIWSKRTKPYKLFRSNNFNSHDFNRFNFEYRRYGNKNPQKFFYVIRRAPGAGFFSNLAFVNHHLLIAEKLKLIPVVDMENYQTIYNCKKKINGTYNSWLYYFKQVSKYSLKEVYQSKNVIICDNRANISKYINDISLATPEHRKIFNKYIQINKEILEKVKKTAFQKFRNKKILGVHYRGSDQKKSGYQPHPATEKQMLNATRMLLDKFKFDKIYLCTEDTDYLEVYKKNFGKKIIYSDVPRTTDDKDLFDGIKNNHRYEIGRGNLIDMLLLSKVDYLLCAPSNIEATSRFIAKKKIPCTFIWNGMKGNIFVAQYSWYLKKMLPKFLGGFDNDIYKKKLKI